MMNFFTWISIVIIAFSTPTLLYGNIEYSKKQDPPKIGHNKNKKINFDLYTGRIDGFLPFDVPFVLKGVVQNDITKIELFFIEDLNSNNMNNENHFINEFQYNIIRYDEIDSSYLDSLYIKERHKKIIKKEIKNINLRKDYVIKNDELNDWKRKKQYNKIQNYNFNEDKTINSLRLKHNYSISKEINDQLKKTFDNHLQYYLTQDLKYYHNSLWQKSIWVKPNKALKPDSSSTGIDTFHLQIPALKANTDYKFYVKVYYSIEPDFTNLAKTYLSNTFTFVEANAKNISTQGLKSIIKTLENNQFTKAKEKLYRINLKDFSGYSDFKTQYLNDSSYNNKIFHNHLNPKTEYVAKENSSEKEIEDLYSFYNIIQNKEKISFDEIIIREIGHQYFENTKDSLSRKRIENELINDTNYQKYKNIIEQNSLWLDFNISLLKRSLNTPTNFDFNKKWEALLDSIQKYSPNNIAFINAFNPSNDKYIENMMGYIDLVDIDKDNPKMDIETAIVNDNLNDLEKNINKNIKKLFSIQNNIKKDNSTNNPILIQNIIETLSRIKTDFIRMKKQKDDLDYAISQFKEYWNWQYSNEIRNPNAFLQSTTNDFITRSEYYISADLGIVNTFSYNNKTYLSPYLGVNFNFTPINRQAKYGLLKGNSYRSNNHYNTNNLFRNMSLNIGVIPKLYHNENQTLKGTWNNDLVLMTGIGLRLTDYIRFVSGAAWYRQEQKEPFRTTYKTRPAFFFGITLDWDVRTTLQSVGTSIFSPDYDGK